MKAPSHGLHPQRHTRLVCAVSADNSFDARVEVRVDGGGGGTGLSAC
ncbi:hypothetical protein [Arthrobacter sp. UYEF21]